MMCPIMLHVIRRSEAVERVLQSKGKGKDEGMGIRESLKSCPYIFCLHSSTIFFFRSEYPTNFARGGHDARVYRCQLYLVNTKF